MRVLAAFFLFCGALCAVTIKLYLADGTHQLVREYEVKQDRVRYFSAERLEWEEIPLDLVDLKKTKAEQNEREERLRTEAQATDAEEKAIRAARRESERVPQEPGVYWINGEQLTMVQQAEPKVVNNKRRQILKVISPIPVVSGKSTVELDGETAPLAIAQDRPEFYMRLAADERFTIVKASLKKGVRVVQTWNLIPVSKELIQEHEEVEIFRHQVGDGLYKIWPQQPVAPGEYAVIEYTEGKPNTRVWDFSVKAAK